MSKFYKVKGDTPLWVEGTIIKERDGGYYAIDDIFMRAEGTSTDWYEGAKVVEAEENADFFERVYEVHLLKKAQYMGKEAAKAALQKFYKEAK